MRSSNLGYVVDPYSFVRSLDWTNDVEGSTLAYYNAGKMYSWTAADMGSKLGFTAKQIIDHFAEYGLTWADPNTSSNLLTNPIVWGAGALAAYLLLK